MGPVCFYLAVSVRRAIMGFKSCLIFCTSNLTNFIPIFSAPKPERGEQYQRRRGSSDYVLNLSTNFSKAVRAWPPVFQAHDNPKSPTNLAQYIRKYRKEKGLSGRELAERLGVAEFTIVKWERGRMPRYKKQIRLLRQGIPGVEAFLGN